VAWPISAGLLLTVLLAPSAAAGSASERHTFRSGAGERDYLLYVPPHSRPIPLLVYLHGCGAPPFVPGLDELARQRGLAVAYPIQSRSANAASCWNWTDEVQTRRGVGEPAIIAGIARQVVREQGIDPARVFVAGHSAGSGMTANVVAAYPDLFAAAAIIAGCGQYTCLDVTGYTAYQRMGRHARPVPAYLLWGTDDPTNPYVTGQLQALQWVRMNDWADDGVPNLSSSLAVSSLAFHPEDHGAPAYVRQGLSGRCGEVQLTSVIGMGHVPDARWPAAFPSMVDFLLGHPMRPGC
jgi:poly(3-hydroxybutyrate) depolymerase